MRGGGGREEVGEKEKERKTDRQKETLRTITRAAITGVPRFVIDLTPLYRKIITRD